LFAQEIIADGIAWQAHLMGKEPVALKPRSPGEGFKERTVRIGLLLLVRGVRRVKSQGKIFVPSRLW
jgi:hypothetical protein